MWEGLLDAWNQVVVFFTQNELIQNVFAPVSGLVGVWFANKTVTLTKENYLAKNVVATKDVQITELKAIVEQQNAKIDTMGAMFMEAFGESNLKADAKKKLAHLYTNFDKVKKSENLIGLDKVKETVQLIQTSPIKEEEVSFIDKLKSGL